jgi:predicted alpha/beta-fold hydrolase
MLSEKNILQKLELAPFQPVYWAKKGMQQSVAAYYYPYNPIIANNDTQHILLPDGDQVFTALNFPILPHASNRIVLMLHGLSGSYTSKYMVRITQKLNQLGIATVRMNLRGHGVGRNLASKLYHGGISEDPSAVLQYLAKQYPNSPVTVLGFSLGANITMKLAGEHKHPLGNMDSLVAVSPPLDLYSCVDLINTPANQFLDQYFSKALVTEVKKIHKQTNLPMPSFPEKLSVLEFDELYTSKINGFENAIHYYNECSALPYVHDINFPTFILHSKDDPLILKTNFEKLPIKSNFDILLTEQGGHVGWLAKGGKRWMDEAVVNWIMQMNGSKKNNTQN